MNARLRWLWWSFHSSPNPRFPRAKVSADENIGYMHINDSRFIHFLVLRGTWGAWWGADKHSWPTLEPFRGELQPLAVEKYVCDGFEAHPLLWNDTRFHPQRRDFEEGASASQFPLWHFLNARLRQPSGGDFTPIICQELDIYMSIYQYVNMSICQELAITYRKNDACAARGASYEHWFTSSASFLAEIPVR